MAGQIQTLQEMINQVVKGKQKVVEKVLCAMLAGGHILLLRISRESAKRR